VGKMTLAPLRQKFAALCRDLYRARPVVQRYASLMTRLAFNTDSAKSLGHGVYRVLVDIGIQGMPEVHGKAPTPRQALPSSYGADWGQKAFRTVLKYTRSEDAAENVCMDFLVDFLSHGKQKVDRDKTAPQVLQWVMTSLVRAAIDAGRRKNRAPGEESMTVEDEGGGGFSQRDVVMQTDLEGVLGTLETFSEAWLNALLEREKPALDKIHPDAYDYLTLLLESDMTDQEILGFRQGKPVGPPKTPYLRKIYPGGALPSMWSAYKKKIFQHLKKVIESGAVPMGGMLGLGAVNRLFDQYEKTEREGGDVTFLLGRLESLLSASPQATAPLSLVRDALDAARNAPSEPDEREFYMSQARQELSKMQRTSPWLVYLRT